MKEKNRILNARKEHKQRKMNKKTKNEQTRKNIVTTFYARRREASPTSKKENIFDELN